MQQVARKTGTLEGIGKEPELYKMRFSKAEEKLRNDTWIILCRNFFQKFVSETDTVLDIGAGDGHFSKNIKAKRRIALDLSPHVEELNTLELKLS